MMTREEANKHLHDDWYIENGRLCVDGDKKDAFLEAIGMGIKALRPVSREPLEKFKEYFDDLYGKGLEVYGWHMNGEAKSFDDFYEDACEYAGL